MTDKEEANTYALDLATRITKRFEAPTAIAALLNAAALIYLVTRWEEGTTREWFLECAGDAYDGTLEAIDDSARMEGSG